MPHYTKCLNCGKTIQYYPSNRRKFCSQKCYYAFERQTEICVCKTCGKQFEAWKHKHRQFCSHQCRAKANSLINTVAKTCEMCGEKYTVPKNRDNKSHYCSKECQYAAQSILNSGENSHWYRDGKYTDARGPNWWTQRKRAAKRDGFKCQSCGKQCGKKKYDYAVHHIKPYREFNGDYLNANKLTNLITVCRKCHDQIEYGDKPCPRPLF